ncbi:hypothetical protein GIB67_041658 [Kingdonia uniflora]|uniref:Epidermal patterning factor-like protein n=1 Tax=Kingdonia uniflora TaxID=39325 RepID=A0A7J7MQU2_9MAGN|nr:hypothetical protein GIB67_041658 [Kingdonia uniflora]
MRRFGSMVIAAMILMVLHYNGWSCVASRPFAAHHNGAHQQAQSKQTTQTTAGLDSQQVFTSKEAKVVKEEACKALSTLGSRPPNCEHKCGGCHPCEAIQVPTTTDQLGLQYTNYEPEGWKCKCGVTFFNP